MNIEKLYVNKIGKGYPIIMLHGFPLDHNSLMPFNHILMKTVNGKGTI